jgi:hypothetical protein
VPEVVDLLHLGEEAMAAEVEAKALLHGRPSDPAELVGRLQDDHRLALLGQQIARGQAGRAAAEHHNGPLRRDISAGRGCRRGFRVWHLNLLE